MNKNKSDKNSGKYRKYTATIVVLVVIVAIINIFQFIFMDDLLISTTKKDMIVAADEILELDMNKNSFMRQISDCEAKHNVYVEIYQPREVLVYTSNNNTWVFDSDANADNQSQLMPRIMKILSHSDIDDESYFETRQEYFASGVYIVYARTFDNNCIEIYRSVESVKSSAKTASWSLFAITMIILAVFVLIAVVFIVAFVVPLNKINTITKKMAQTDFSQVCPEFAIRELSELSSSVNALSASLDLALRDLYEKNEKLESDIDRQRKNEETRKYFIANASHELKTPISIIQGYAEAMLLGIDEESKSEYCNIIIEETEKMNSLVMRLLQMTKYEYGYVLNCNAFHIKDLIDSYLSSRLRHIEDLGIEVICNVDEAFMGYGDFEILENVLSNYITNAVSHISGEKKIKIGCELVATSYRVSVFNTGLAIGDEDIDNIWQSFYRADKARSRAEGRFGLGLALVAASQNLHAQQYGVSNKENGVEFWFDISGYNIE